MPRIRWTNLPESIRKHLLLRLKERQITEEDLLLLKLWRESEPDAPDGPWYKDFGSFKICGEGEFPSTFLLRGQAAKGQKL
jgi:hypothetical protein